ncbi:MAG: hypothetical protein OXM56_01600, partial [Gammaproteobacteria bacterium]|nr:hypothetical protein [Gammaproteobacteria bacterium]
GIFITPDDAMWIITHRDNVEGVAYGSLAGRIMRVDIDTGEILGAMESPGHWIDVSAAGEIYIASLTGSVFKWYEAEEAPPGGGAGAYGGGGGAGAGARGGGVGRAGGGGPAGAGG